MRGTIEVTVWVSVLAFRGRSAMTRIFGLCPRCKGRIKINDADRLNGRKIICRDCGEKIRIRVPQSSRGGDSGDSEVFDLDESCLVEDVDGESVAFADDEYAAPIDDELPVYRPQLKRTKKKAESTFNEDGAAASSTKKQPAAGSGKPKQSPLVMILACSGALVLASGAVGGLLFLRGAGLLKPGKFHPPEKYVAIRPPLASLSGQIPEGWTESYAGGRNRIPVYARFSDGGSITIELRETVGSSGKGKLMNAVAIGRDPVGIGHLNEAPQVDETHEFHRQIALKNYAKWDEDPSRPIETQGFGDGRISNFTARETMFSSTIKGCRASVVSVAHQYNIVCTCPPSQFKDVAPVFEKIIASLGSWEK
jgi:hypothetical protein